MSFSASRFPTVFSAVFVFSMPAALAQPSALRELCQGISNSLASFETVEVARDETRCVIRNGVIDGGERVRWHFTSLAIGGDYGTSGRQYPQLPPRGSFELENPVPLSGRFPGQDYITRNSASPVTYRFSYDFDPDAGALRIAELSAVGKSGRLALAGEAKVNFDLRAELHAFEEYAEDTEVAKVSLEVVNSGLFESLALPFLVGLIGFDVDPEPRIKDWQDRLSKGIDALPQDAVSVSSKAAFKKFIGEFPHPVGPFRIALEFSPPVSAEAVRRGEVGALEILRSARIEAVYE